MSSKEAHGVLISRPGRKRGSLTKGVNCLSWDCGTTNLCYCLLEYIGQQDKGGKEFRVVMWENFSLNAQSIKHAVEMLPRELDRRPWMLDADYVCIESQVVNNIEMKVVSHALQMYFITRTLPSPTARAASSCSSGTSPLPKPMSVHFVSAKSKFTVCEVEEPNLKTRRAKNKRMAVMMAQKLLEQQGDTQTLRYLNKHTKKDDLADSFIQCLYFLRIVFNRANQTNKVLKHLGLDPDAKDDGVVIDININEGREVHTEIPLPQMYRCETFTHPVYSVESVADSDRYARQPMQSRWGGAN